MKFSAIFLSIAFFGSSLVKADASDSYVLVDFNSFDGSTVGSCKPNQLPINSRCNTVSGGLRVDSSAVVAYLPQAWLNSARNTVTSPKSVALVNCLSKCGNGGHKTKDGKQCVTKVGNPLWYQMCGELGGGGFTGSYVYVDVTPRHGAKVSRG